MVNLRNRKAPLAEVQLVGHKLSERFEDPDLVARILEYCIAVCPEIGGRRIEIERAVRDEFASQQGYVRRYRKPADLATDVLRMFNGRNATEVARMLRISRATVYRLLKQPAKA